MANGSFDSTYAYQREMKRRNNAILYLDSVTAGRVRQRRVKRIGLASFCPVGF